MLKSCLKLAGLAAAGLLIGSQAYAADLPVKAPPMAPVEVPPPPLWTGFYIGANIGWGFANVGTNGVSSNLDGVIGGGQLGYNWQTGPLVLGIEGDFQGSDEHKSDSAFIDGTRFTVDQQIPWFATLRGRIGYANGPWLLYFTGGAAWQNFKLSVTANGQSISDNATKTGYTVGGGVEWMFAPRWSAKLEYLYMDTGHTDVTLFDTNFEGHARNNVVRVGVNYHF